MWIPHSIIIGCLVGHDKTPTDHPIVVAIWWFIILSFSRIEWSNHNVFWHDFSEERDRGITWLGSRKSSSSSFFSWMISQGGLQNDDLFVFIIAPMIKYTSLDSTVRSICRLERSSVRCNNPSHQSYFSSKDNFPITNCMNHGRKQQDIDSTYSCTRTAD